MKPPPGGWHGGPKVRPGGVPVIHINELDLKIVERPSLTLELDNEGLHICIAIATVEESAFGPPKMVKHVIMKLTDIDLEMLKKAHATALNQHKPEDDAVPA